MTIQYLQKYNYNNSNTLKYIIILILNNQQSTNIKIQTNNLTPNLTPSTIIIDYKPALRDSLMTQFPGAQAHKCLFRHNQVICCSICNKSKV